MLAAVTEVTEVIVRSSHMVSPIVLWFLQLLLMAILLCITRLAVKLGWVKSLWISTGFTFIATILFLTLLAGLSLMWSTIFLCSLPLLIFAVVMAIRALVRVCNEMDDGGSVNSAERERTLEMVEQGKISAEEGAELLEALGRSNAMLGQDKFSRVDMLILIGIAITVFGFFLPWLEFGLPNLANFQSQQIGGAENPLASIFRSAHSGRPRVSQSGYQTGAVGWAIFIIAVLAVVPVFITPKDFLYKISMLQIFLVLLDVALVLSMLIRVGGSMSAGLPICLVGLVLAAVACFRKFKRLAA